MSFTNNEELNLPWKIYFFDSNGKYDPKIDVITLEDPNQLKTNKLLRDCILEHNKYKLEVRICDCLDYCIIHFKDGQKVFPL